MNDLCSFLIGGIAPDKVEAFARVAFGLDSAEAGVLIEELLEDGLSAESLMLDLLAPAARLMGELWCSDEANFLDVTLGVSRIQQLIRRMRVPVTGFGAERGTALLMPTPGEQHVLGLRMVEELMMRDGWGVCLAPVARDHLAGQLSSAESYDIVGFSLSSERLLPVLRQAIAEVRAQSRNRAVRIMVGGVAFAGEQPLEPPPGTDAVVADAREAVLQARRWHELAAVT